MRFSNLIRRLSLTQRLIALILVASLPGFAALAYNAYDLRNTRYAEVRDETIRNNQFVVSEIDQIFDGFQATLLAVAQASEVRTADEKICSDYVTRVRAEIEALTSILVLNLDGNIRCFSEARLASPNLADRDYFQDAVKNKRFAIGTYTASRVSPRKIVPLAMPIMTGESVTGLVLAGLNLEWFGAQLKGRGLAKGGALLVADRNGITIAREPFPERFVGTPVIDTVMALVKESAAGTRDILNADGVERTTTYVPPSRTPFGFFVATGVSKMEALAPIDRAVRASIALFALGSLVAIGFAWLVGEGIIRRPLMGMIATAETWRRGQDKSRSGIAASSGDEFGFLGQTFDRLMDESASRQEEREIAEQRREILVHELAHRVKNTLAIVQSIASLSFRHSQGPEALRGFQDRLQALVRGHDLLTRRDWQHADLAEIVEAAMAPMTTEHGHRVAFSGPPVDLPPSTAVPMAMILHELCTNAVKYGALSTDQGKVTIGWTVAPDSRGTAVSLIWSEEGGPAVQSSGQEGFGSRLITNLTKQMSGGFEIRYPPSGVVCNIRLIAPKSEPRDRT